MAPDPAVVAAMEAAVAQSPDNAALRVHLAELYLAAGRANEADAQIRLVLGRTPDHQPALAAGIQAARAVGESARAEAYERILAALDGYAGATPIHFEAGRGDERADPASPIDVGLNEGEASAAEAGGTEREAPRLGDGDVSEAELDAFLEDVLAEGSRRRVTLSDVAGLDEVKRRLELSFLGPMRHPEMRRLYGKSLRGGLLLYGPPGCGKTFLARAVAGELGAQFLAVELHDILDMWLGKSEQNMHRLFQLARRRRPCVMFLDEVDALGMKRSNLAHSAGRNVVVQLLTELDSTENDNEGVFVLGATNQPWDVDPALRRPGRFDRMLLVLPPDAKAREAILRYHLRDRPVEDVDVAAIADRTDRFSGADLRLLCEAAAESALEASMTTGVPRPIGMADLTQALKSVRPSTEPWFEVARNFAQFGNQSGTYDDLLQYMRRRRMI